MGSPRDGRVLLAAARTGAADFRRNYSWRSWTFGYLVRVLLEVAFFGLIGVLLRDPTTAAFLAVGRAVFVGPQEAMWTIQSTVWERQSGTLPLIVSSPGRAWPVFAGRSTQWFASATATSVLSLVLVTPLFGQVLDGWQVAAAIAGIVVGVVATYAFAMPIAALVLRAPGTRNLVSNLAHTIMALVCGVVVPVAFWPPAVQAIAQVVPVTHSLGAVRAVLETTGPAALVVGLPGMGIALAIGACWFVLGAWMLERLTGRARTDASIDLEG